MSVFRSNKQIYAQVIDDVNGVTLASASSLKVDEKLPKKEIAAKVGEMIASNNNSGKSYREGIELEAAWKPCPFFRWDANATWARSINKDWTVTLKDGSAANLGDTHTTFSPDFIFNNILTFTYAGFNTSVQSQYIGKQYLTNTDFDSYKNYNGDGSFDRNVDMFLKKHFTTNVDLRYRFALPHFGIKDAAIGITDAVFPFPGGERQGRLPDRFEHRLKIIWMNEC